MFKANPNHPGLRFKRARTRAPRYSIRVGLDYRALALLENGTLYWFWIGPHAEYDKLLARL